jgi:hypothetical protein
MSMVIPTATDWWAGAASALFGAVIGSCIPLWWSRRLRRIERRGEIIAMHVELFRVFLTLRELIAAGIAAPLYRLPISITEHALPKLIGDGVLDSNEVYALVEFVNRIEEMNRGLDRAGNAHALQDARLLLSEHKRNVAKATEILEEKLERHRGQSVFDATEDALIRLEGTGEDTSWVWNLGQMQRPETDEKGHAPTFT